MISTKIINVLNYTQKTSLTIFQWVSKTLLKLTITVKFSNELHKKLFHVTGNLTAGNYSEKNGLKGLRQCVMACCLSDTCNIVFIVDRRCFHVECVSDELCLPLPRVGSRKWDAHVSMILVKPVLPNGKEF